MDICAGDEGCCFFGGAKFDAIVVLAAGNCLLFACGAWCIYQVVTRLTTPRWGLVALIAAELLVGFSPWLSVTYSDALTVVVPAALGYLYVLQLSAPNAQKRALLGVGMGIIGILGYRIKPQVVFMLIALVAVQAVQLVALLATHKQHPQAYRKPLLVVGAVLASGAVTFGLTALAANSLPFSLDAQQALVPEHYLMMGINADTQGTYSEEDVTLSRAQPTKQARAQADMAEYQARLVALGPKGIALLLSSKLMTNYSDGTFAWTEEGDWYKHIDDREYPQDLPSSLVRFAYVRLVSSKAGRVWSSFEQALWLALLGCCLLGLLPAHDAS